MRQKRAVNLSNSWKKGGENRGVSFGGMRATARGVSAEGNDPKCTEVDVALCRGFPGAACRAWTTPLGPFFLGF